MSLSVYLSDASSSLLSAAVVAFTLFYCRCCDSADRLLFTV